MKTEALPSYQKLPEGIGSTGLSRVTASPSDKRTKDLPALVIRNHRKHTTAGTAPNASSSTECHRFRSSNHLPGTRESHAFVVPEAILQEAATK